MTAARHQGEGAAVAAPNPNRRKPGTRTADPKRPLDGDMLALWNRFENGLTKKAYQRETGFSAAKAHDLYHNARRYAGAVDVLRDDPVNADALADIGRFPHGPAEALLRLGGYGSPQNITSLRQLAERQYSRRELRAIPGIGPKAIKAVETILAEHGLSLRADDTPAPERRTPEELRHAEADRLRHHDYLALVAMYRRHGADAYARMILAAGREAEGYPPVGQPEPLRLSERGDVVAFPGCELPGGAA